MPKGYPPVAFILSLITTILYWVNFKAIFNGVANFSYDHPILSFLIAGIVYAPLHLLFKIGAEFQGNKQSVKQTAKFLMYSYWVSVMTTVFVAGFQLHKVSGFDAFLSGIFTIPFAFIGFFGYINVTFPFFLLLPTFILGGVAIRTKHPATDAIKRAASTKRPDHEVEKELALLMSSQDATDADLWELYNELSPALKLGWKMKLSIRAFKARKLREVAEAHREAIVEETELAKKVHETERTKRGYAPDIKDLTEEEQEEAEKLKAKANDDDH